MSLLPAFINARLRKTDSAPQTGTTTDSRQPDSPADDSDDNIFNLLPPQPSETAASEPQPEPKPQGRNRHPVDMTDLSRLSIDRDGRLYWDGKPVETHHRLSMSRPQIIGASLVAAFIVIGAIASAIQGTVAARELACRLGWSADACIVPGAQPKARPDIPA
jgi:hypothetical protein